MGRRQDGRIEPGQSLKSAISARAWNRAQDAADLVLGDRVGFGAEAAGGLPGRLFASVYLGVSAQAGTRRVRFGMIACHSAPFRDFGGNLPTSNAILGQRPPTAVGITGAEILPAEPFINRRRTANLNFGVICGGRVPAETGYSVSLDAKCTICTQGTCLAMVRKNPGGLLPKVRPAVIRYASDTASNLKGIAEDSDCGAAQLVYWTNIKPFSPEQQAAEGIESPEPLDDTTNNIYYAVIRL